MNERIKELRKALGLSGEKFGESLGVQRMAISLLESGKNNLTDQMIKLICLTYNVNEDWLRTGEGSMFNETPQDYLKELQRRHNLTDFQLEIVKTYLELSEANKSAIDDFISSCAKNTKDKEI